MNEETDKRLQRVNLAVANLDKKYGKGSVTQLDDDPQPWEAISTGLISVDSALGIGGFPKGRIAEIMGNEGAGKSSLALGTVASAQAEGGLAAFIDAEHALDPQYAKKMGVDTDSLFLAQPTYGEEGLDIAEQLTKTGDFSIVVVDSVAALIPKVELEGDIGDQHVGLQARMMGQAMRKLSGVVAESNTLLLFINQLREKVGAFVGGTTTPGGRALKYQSSVRVQMRQFQKLTNSSTGEVTGVKIKVEVIKNKMAPPFKTVEFDIANHKGIDKHADLLDKAIEVGAVKKSGAWFARDGDTLAQGRPKMIELLENDDDFYSKLYKEVAPQYIEVSD